ncbi:hypothetical protein RSAG8_13032, partial [Rhizoctonia solani AG-8 WAC10335]
MEPGMSQQQMEWMASNSRANPASEGEFLQQELALGHLSVQRYHVRRPGFDVTRAARPTFTVQLLWDTDKKFDWFWVRLENVETIERRTDTRFRGGEPCIWLTTPIATYAMTAPHPEYTNDWHSVLELFNVAPINAWPKQGYRPLWWPWQSSGEWPYQRDPKECYSIVSPQDEIRQLAELLSAEQISSRATWHRLGAHVDHSLPGQPMHNLSQLLDWELAFDGGLKITHDRLDNASQMDRPEDDSQMAPDEESVQVARGQRKRRKQWLPRDLRVTRPKREDSLTK